ncbi:hypothetical protein HanIR_Chr06g0282221 [Helianthus annuus]|nr:hypothetical protein HanIR_Chr06g0282221 [Helianthus annuus]
MAIAQYFDINNKIGKAITSTYELTEHMLTSATTQTNFESNKQQLRQTLKATKSKFPTNIPRKVEHIIFGTCSAKVPNISFSVFSRTGGLVARVCIQL